MNTFSSFYARGRRAFTLIELLVVVAIIALLAGLLFPVLSRSKVSAQQTACASNLRQIGAALALYAGDHEGSLPETSHTAAAGDSWVYTLAPYLQSVDKVRICPADPRGAERLAARGTSYTLNSFLFVPEIGPFGELLSEPLNHVARIPRPAMTMVAFNISDSTPLGATSDHTHSDRWTSWNKVRADIEPNRFRTGGADTVGINGSANYLFADWHVENRNAAEVKKQIDAGINIARPPE